VVVVVVVVRVAPVVVRVAPVVVRVTPEVGSVAAVGVREALAAEANAEDVDAVAVATYYVGK
jgi:hypothetical protein